MINHNVLLEDMFNRTLKVEFQGAEYTSNFMEGDLFELWRVINASPTKYPIIWMQSGYEVEEFNNTGNPLITLSGLNFFLITKGGTNDRNTKRYRTTFENQLYPLKDMFIRKMQKAKGFTISDKFKSSSFPFNEINDPSVGGMKMKSQNATIDVIWDAVYLHIPEIKINTNCYPEYLINKNYKKC